MRCLEPRNASARRSGSPIVRAITVARSSRAPASAVSGCRRTGRAASRRSCSGATSFPSGRKPLDESLPAFANRPFQEPFPYLIVDARYEKVCEVGIVMGQAGADVRRD